ncbi:MAG: multiple sugar transport system permease protein [Candidatus Sumerlaeota bacterium]|nr:multiple sugar transport system permease protein [Candidatus Sumerlaeota bacterium]
MLSPALILFGVFIGLPMILAIVIAFKHIDLAAGISASPWVGLQNFRDLFDNVLLAERVVRAFKNTLLFTICFVPLNILASIVIATLIHAIKSRSKSFYRAAFYLPTVTSAIVFAMIWKWLYDANFGLLNYVLGEVGIAPINWTGDPQWAIWAVIIAALGAGPGGNILIYLAALGSVPEDLNEAARVDGANLLLRWWTVTVPALKPVTLYLIVLNTIGSFQVFELVFILTNGGPAGSSTVLVYEIYSLAFIQGRYGTAGALSLILLAIVTCFTMLQFFVFGRDTTRSGKPGPVDRMFISINDAIADLLNVIGNAPPRIMASFRTAARRALRRSGDGAVSTVPVPWHRRLLPPGSPLRSLPERLPSSFRPAAYRMLNGLRRFVRRAVLAPDSPTRVVLRELPVHVLLFPLALLFLFPMIWMFLSALTPRIYLQSSPPEVSLANLSFENYGHLARSAPDLWRWFWNSSYLSMLVMAVQVLLSCLTGYVFARLVFPGRRLIFSLFISSIILPGQALVIPLFIVISSGIRNVFGLDLLNTHWALILPPLCSPVGIFLMRQYIDGMPRELDEAARIDGCNEFATWWRVILPLCRPVIAAWGILTFTGIWKSFFWPFVVLGSEKLFTLEVGLQTLQQQNVADFGLIMAGATTSAIPMIVVFFIFQKQIVAGLTFGAVKG